LEPKAYGTFKRRGPHIFRTEARLQWGESNKPLGIIIMLNPGSSMIADYPTWDWFENIDEDTDINNEELELDDTMDAVAAILEETHPRLDGYLEIRNLFNLRTEQSSASIAIQVYKDILNEELYDEVLHSGFDDLDKFPWVWIGWTVETAAILKKRRLYVLKRIPKEMHRFAICKQPPSGIPHPEFYSYHPYPIIRQRVEDYQEAMIEQMRNYWEKEKA
jgi:hypothetical protein